MLKLAKNSRRVELLTATLFGAVSILIPPSTNAKDGRPSISIVLTSQPEPVCIGSDVRIDVAIKNISSRPVQHTTAPGIPGRDNLITLVVKDSRGETLPEKEPDQSACNGRQECKIVRLHVGSEIQRMLM